MASVKERIHDVISLLRYLAAQFWGAFRSLPPVKQVFLVAGLSAIVVATILINVPPLKMIREWASQLGAWFPIVFFLLYVLVTLFPIPRTIFTLTSGVLFPPAIAIMICLSATSISAMLAFVITRYIARDWVQEHLHHPMLDALNERLWRRGWLAVGSLRLIPFVPFSVLNYAAALTPVRFMPYTLATIVCMSPGTIAGTLLGEAAVNTLNLAMIALTVCGCTAGAIGLTIDALVPATTSLHASPRQQNEADER